MSFEWFILGILVILILGQQAFWMLVTLKLADRVMAKSYYDYAQGERVRKPVAKTTPSQRLAVVDPIADDHADKANRLFT